MHVGTVAFAGMDDEHAGLRAAASTSPARRDRRPEQADIVAERFAKTARLEKITLHIDDDQRGACQIDFDRDRLGSYLGIPDFPFDWHEESQMGRNSRAGVDALGYWSKSCANAHNASERRRNFIIFDNCFRNSMGLSKLGLL